MARQSIPFIVQDTTGAVVEGASVHVTLRADNSDAVVYQGETGVTTKSNPIITDSIGRIVGWLDPGAYNLTVSGTGITGYTQAWDVAEKGDKGDPGTPGAQGQTGINFQGDWVMTRTYSQQDAVYYNGATWMATGAVPTGTVPGAAAATSTFSNSGGGTITASPLSLLPTIYTGQFRGAIVSYRYFDVTHTGSWTVRYYAVDTNTNEAAGGDAFNGNYYLFMYSVTGSTATYLNPPGAVSGSPGGSSTPLTYTFTSTGRYILAVQAYGVKGGQVVIESANGFSTSNPPTWVLIAGTPA